VNGTVYREVGARGTTLLSGPLFALAGYLLELLAGDRPHLVTWVCVALGLLAFTALWVYARRRFLAVRVTAGALWQGRECLPVARIVELDDVGAPAGTRVLGGGWSAPRTYEQLPLRLDDGTVVLAWARDAGALRHALRSVMENSAP
jgi:hypothetical protein